MKNGQTPQLMPDVQKPSWNFQKDQPFDQKFQDPSTKPKSPNFSLNQQGHSKNRTSHLSEFMASAVRQSTELADLSSLIHINQHLSNLLDLPEPKPRLPWPLEPERRTLLPQSAPFPTRLIMPRFSNVNGSKLHTYPMRAAPYPLSYDQTVLDRFVTTIPFLLVSQ